MTNDGTPVSIMAAVALIRRLRNERDEARNKALDEAAGIVWAERNNRCYCSPDGPSYCLVCEFIDAAHPAILALKTQEPKPSKETDWGPPVGKETI